MATPDRISNECMMLAPPDPVTTKVRHWFYLGSDLMFVIDCTPNTAFGMVKVFGQGWIVKARAWANGEYSVEMDTEEFDGEDPLDYPLTPTNANIPGPTLTLEYDT